MNDDVSGRIMGIDRLLGILTLIIQENNSYPLVMTGISNYGTPKLDKFSLGLRVGRFRIVLNSTPIGINSIYLLRELPIKKLFA